MTNRREIPEAKSERTRRKIVSAAAAAYRERGIDGVGVRDIMQRAGLTQGGFYFHFSDKDALLAEASRDGFEAITGRLLEHVSAAAPGERLQTFINAYLSPWHRDHPEAGCMMAALASEVARRDRKTRQDFIASATRMIDQIAPYVPGQSASEQRQKADLLLSSMSGVLMVSRVIVNRSRSDALLAAARSFFSANFSRD
ncbi:TetR/AcrR family transcriptional regulator [Burkholderia sp. MR1-5-21]